MADRVALMRAGRLVQAGRPTELYFAPADAFVASFFGEVNLLTGTIEHGRVATPFGDLAVHGIAEGTPVEVLIRPEALHLTAMTPAMAAGERGAARVMAARMLGRSSLVHLSVDNANGQDLHLHARIPGRYLPKENELLAVHLDHSQAFVFPLGEGG